MRVLSIQVVSAFQENKQAILASGQTFLTLAKALNAKVQQLNVPEIAPPEVPRLLFQRSDVMAALSFARLEVTARPPSHIANNFRSSLDFAARSSLPLVQDLVAKYQQYTWTGSIVALEYQMPGKGISSHKRLEPCFDRMLTIQRNGRPLGAFNVQFGFQEAAIYRGFTVRAFEIRAFQVEGPGVVSLEAERGEIESSGIEILLDVNNKRADKRGDPASDIGFLLTEQKALYDNMLDTLNLRGVLDEYRNDTEVKV